jgi:hypothetical protein
LSRTAASVGYLTEVRFLSRRKTCPVRRGK